jgi:hypothetical protein
MRRNWTLVVLSALCIVAVIALRRSTSAADGPSGFMAEIFTQVPGKPLGLTFAPDGKLIVCAWTTAKSTASIRTALKPS